MQRFWKFLALLGRAVGEQLIVLALIVLIVAGVYYGGRWLFMSLSLEHQLWLVLEVFGSAIVLALYEGVVKPIIVGTYNLWHRAGVQIE